MLVRNSLILLRGLPGAGKSTLLNVLNGVEIPSGGQVLINGKNIHIEKKFVEGVIGHVTQDDLLIEELTVYQNLFYNAKLCFGNLTDEEIAKKIGADAVIYQTLENLKRCIQEINPELTRFEASCFDGNYITGDIDDAYLSLCNIYSCHYVHLCMSEYFFHKFAWHLQKD